MMFEFLNSDFTLPLWGWFLLIAVYALFYALKYSENKKRYVAFNECIDHYAECCFQLAERTDECADLQKRLDIQVQARYELNLDLDAMYKKCGYK